VGIPLAVIVTACAAYCFFRRRSLRVDDAVPPAPQYQSWAATDAPTTTVYSGVPKPEEGYYGAPKPDGYYGPLPVELGVEATSELDADPRGQRPRYELG
jgi:hypothetical protein